MRSNLSFVTFAALLLAVLAGCGGDDDESGACVSGTGVSAACRDDYSSGQCQLINAQYHVGKSCRDLGFR
jgi:hypothetical protein